MKKIIVSVLGIIVLFASTVIAQSETTILELDQFLDIVKQHHPVSYKSDLLLDMAQSNELMARGGFDPKLEADYDQKFYDKKNYYSLLGAGLKIPTWFGADVKVGYDNSQGQFLDRSDLLPAQGIWNLGISVPLGKGLVIDERRAILKQAKVLTKMSLQDQRILLNELLFEAAVSYLQWQESTLALAIKEEGEALARDRFVATVESFEKGDKPAIDTLESLLALQSRQQDVMMAQQELENARLLIENFLWLDGNVPLELESLTRPEEIQLPIYQSQIDSILAVQSLFIKQHPELLLYEYKRESLEIENRLNREALKPDIQVGYFPLVGTNEESLLTPFDIQDYKLGATFNYPLFLRKERGKIKMTNLKLQEVQYDVDLKEQSLGLKLDTYQNNMAVFENQVTLLEEIQANYQELLTAENLKFSIGESSIFLVNAREVKYLESRLKLLSTQLKLQKNKFGYLFSAGYLPNL